jgi:NADH-quinone oxidoreductase subunit F
VRFDEIQEEAQQVWQAFEDPGRERVLVGAGTCGKTAGADDLVEAIRGELPAVAPNAELTEVGCLGLCYAEPLVELRRPGAPRTLYGGVSVENVAALLHDYFRDKKLRPDLALAVMDGPAAEGIPTFEELPMLRGQVRIVLRNAGRMDPNNIRHYIGRGGYEGLAKALRLAPHQVIDEVKKSGLRGRGGAGFPTGLKWELCYRAAADRKYLICNADEGDPGAFMDRSVIESDPHAVLEGMMIAAYAIGASEAYVYVHVEYPLAIARLHEAIREAEQLGILGDNVLGSGLSLHVHIATGAGAFVCGEETALIASMEGRRGMPQPRPPFPAQSGLHGAPTNINNVETLADIPPILRRGALWFARYGTPKSRGTKTFALTGKVARTGLIEVPLGTSLQEIVFGIGGGVPGGRRLRAVQTGGPSGGCIPAAMLHMPADYEALAEAGSIMGSGGMVVMDEDTCMVDIARYFVEFTQNESCGKCVPCRLGTTQMLHILDEITAGRGRPEQLDILADVARAVKLGSLCGLGQAAPNPVLTTLRHFRDEYEAHIYERRCPNAVCPAMAPSPCGHSCPAGVDVPRYIRAIARGDYAQAAAVVLDRLPFLNVCGRVCSRPCELRCRRSLLDAAVAVRALERFAGERYARQEPPALHRADPTGRKVAVVGSGPSGLTAGYYLSLKGHAVDVFERGSEAGGVLRTRIPPFRLPRETLEEDIERVRQAGVTLRTGQPVESPDRLLQSGYDAVLLATGRGPGARLGIPGESLPAVHDGITFLRRVNNREQVDLGPRVVVVGGGSSAIDAARTARRLGAPDVTVVYRRTRDDMPADAEEVQQAVAENVSFVFLAAPVAIRHNEDALVVQCAAMRPGPVDASGRRRPVPVEGATFPVEADSVVVAIGQEPENPPGMEDDFDRRGRLRVDRLTLQTPKTAVFATGHLITGPAPIIEAIASGRRAASTVDSYLGGTGELPQTLPPETPAPEPAVAQVEAPPRAEPAVRPVADRVKDFAEVQLGLTEEQALREAARCVRCDLEDMEEL